MTPGAKFRQALAAEKPLQVIGAIVAYHALLAKRTGYRAIYLSGGRTRVTPPRPAESSEPSDLLGLGAAAHTR